jgi:hypothetical protein
LAQSLSEDLSAGPLDVERAIAKHEAWRAEDDTLASKIQAAEELETFIEEHVEEVKRMLPNDGLSSQSSRKRGGFMPSKRGRR